MKVIGVSGPIGAGKSQIVQALVRDQLLARDLGGKVIAVDADAVLREARSNSADLQRAIDAVVPGVLRSDGSVDSAALSSIAFEQPDLLRKLETLQWPIVRTTIQEARLEGERSGAALLLVEAIALLDAGLLDLMDGLLLIDAPREIRQARLIKRGVGAQDFERREEAQRDLRARLLAAGAWPIDARGSVEEGVVAAANALRLLCSIGE